MKIITTEATEGTETMLFWSPNPFVLLCDLCVLCGQSST
jgi:hypothetical protein